MFGGDSIKNFINEELNTITAFGHEEKRNIKMFKKANFHKLIDELDNIENLKKEFSENNDIYQEIIYTLYKIKDIKNSITRLSNKQTLDEIELFEIKNFAINNEELIRLYSKLNLKIDYINLISLDKIIKMLDPDDLKLSTFHIYDSYSQELSNLRKEKAKLEGKIFLENDINIIEKLKNDRLDIVVQEENECLKIKKHITSSLYYYLENIKTNIKSIGKLDLLLGKVELANRYNGIKPNINCDNKIILREIVNPKVANILNKANKKYMPISIELTKKITLITGANMGGKSVSLNTVALNLYLFQCGFYVFAKEADLCVLDFIYLVSDDMQDVNKGLSTFGAEIIKLKEITKLMKIQDGFIALDEFARGTNPCEGRILLKSICTYFKNFNSISLICTHYDDIIDQEIDHYQVVGLKNVNFDKLKRQMDLKISHKNYNSTSIDILQENMDYNLEKVGDKKEVPKDAINICKLLGLEDEIVEIAKNIK